MKGKLQPPSNKSISMDRIPVEKLSSKLATNFFVERKFVPATAKKRLRKASLNEQQISQIYKMPFSATKDIQLSMFQFKILYHILPTNATLYKFGIKEHDRCHLCAEKQTITHLFVTCPNASAVLDTFFSLVARKKTTLRSRFLKHKHFMALLTPCLSVLV